MHSDRNTFDVFEGMSVISADGENLGKVDRVEGDVMVVREGFFFPKDHYIPLSAVAQTDGDETHLSVTKDAALNQGWDQPQTGTVTTEAPAYDTDAAYDGTGNHPLDTDPQPFDHEQNSQRTHVNEDDEIMVPVHEEELTATKRGVERGTVRVEKDVVAVEQELDVPVTEEEVHVSRRAVNREAVPSDAAFDEGTIEVPVFGEEVDVQKRARVREEVEISKDAVTETERVTDTVRREEVTIEDGTDEGDIRRR